MKRYVPYTWWRCCILVFCLFGSNALFAQQTSDPEPLVFEGSLNGRNSSGNKFTSYVKINAGDQITANALCEVASDGNRRIDPVLYIYAPRDDGSEEREEWVNDDNSNVVACLFYGSSQITFTAPVSGTYEFLIDNVADRDGPFRLEIYGITATTQPDNNQEQPGNNQEEEEEEENEGTQECSGGNLVSKLGEIGCVFSTPDDGGQRVDVYGVDSDSVGYYVLTVHTNHLGAVSDSETLIASGHGGMFQVYHLPHGYLRITAGPNPEGKIFEALVSVMPSADSGGTSNGLSTMGTTTTMATPTPEPAPSFQAVHVVQQGETIYSIAGQYGVTVQAIAAANGIGSDYIIHAGNQLNIPAP